MQRYICLNPEYGKTFTVLTDAVFSRQKLKLRRDALHNLEPTHGPINRIAIELGKDCDSVHASAKKVMETYKEK